MKHRPVSTPVRFFRYLGLATITSVLFVVTACSPGEKAAEGPRAYATVEGGKIVVAGARPQFPADATPVVDGFFESARWDEGTFTLHCKGWAPLDVRGDNVRFVLRDPFDRLRVEGTPTFMPQDRADVASARPQTMGLLHAGFTASLRLTNLPEPAAWIQTLELYCLDGDGPLYRLTRVDAPERRSWDRAADRFEIALTYVAPEAKVAEKKNGSLDLFEPTAAAYTVRLAGWAAFDGQSPRSQLIVQLPPSAAPASIVSATWTARPDVRAAVDPQRAELDRCGFDLLLRVNCPIADLRQPGALRLWSVDAAHTTTELATAALRPKK